MKKLILSLMAASVAATSFAHGGGSIHPGDFIVYGNVGVIATGGTYTEKLVNANSNTTDNDKVTMWRIAPGVGYNITDHITIGLDGFYSNSRRTIDPENLNPSSSNPQIDQYKTFGYGIGAFGRYTQAIGERFFVYGQLTAHYLDGRETSRYITARTGGDTYTSDDNYNGFDASFYPALGFNITKTWAMNFAFGGIGYEYKNWDYSTLGEPAGTKLEGTESTFAFTFGRQFNIGIQKTIGCHRRHGNAGPNDDMHRMDVNDDESDHKH